MAVSSLVTSGSSNGSSSIPCNCNRAVLCFVPALLWVLILGEFFNLLTRIFVRFYSENFYSTDFTQTTIWSAASPFLTGLWMIFWAIITQSSPTDKASFLAKLALIDVKNMFPGLTGGSNSGGGGTGDAASKAESAASNINFTPV